MEFYHLRSFVVVAETGNLTKAAKQLFTTPPAVSAHIRALEDELKTTLFERTSKGMRLTPKGEQLRLQAQKTLDSATDMVNLAVENADQVIGTFKLGLNRDASTLRIAELVKALVHRCPGIELELHALNTGQILEKVSRGELDGGFVYGDISPDLFHTELALQPITTIVPTSFDITAIQSIYELAELPWITVGEQCPFDTALQKRITQSIKSQVKSADNTSRASLVEQGVGASFVELEVAQAMVTAKQAQRLTLLDFEIPLSLVAKKSGLTNPVVKTVLKELEVLW
ncbi:LysR family transcriptional regulator [Pseudoalteromonas umbrosa]|uniref:LysR family transcriptional regulator n=1 Tax=Pseudoalteromonas umbrosa TaxID=3048489 RepID=UPI0024C3F280|nr:LysR family transcriptional regulator [Pseudoalteromonas sp. B95]MDK1288815.1 LysR family transcriptional regulator [Pseudoalteromonas sp. B95]